ncbi:MAG: ATP-binding protein [Deltaproteobacteria bacterium]|nr:ATP-binding protein [Deltaproteobacteria bacterium]
MPSGQEVFVLDAKLKEVILAMNPWLLEPGRWSELVAEKLPATYAARDADRIADSEWGALDRAHMVVGPRQAGKSSLVWRHLAQAKPRVLFMNMEEPRIRAWCESPAVFVKELKECFSPLDVLFVDEVQHVDEAGLFVKGVVDLRPGCRFLVTGSSSYHLRGRTRESLAGRATRTTLYPFSFSECLQASRRGSGAFDQRPEVAGRAVAESIASEALKRHVRFGGYPKAWLGDAPEKTLDELVEAFLLRDASDFFKIKRPDALRRLLGLMAAQTGALVNVSEWASLCGISRNTVLEYVQIIEDAHLAALLPVFAAGKRAELTASRKVFFVDNGIRNAILRDFRAPEDRVDTGASWENWVFSELRKRVGPAEGLHYWRTKSGAEVDFVFDTGRGVVGVEVKAAVLGGPRLSRSSRSFIDAYQPREFLVVNRSFSHHETVSGCPVRWLKFSELPGWPIETPRQ